MEIDILTAIMSHLYVIVEFISLIIAVFYYPYLKRCYMKWVLPFLGFIFLSEFTIAYQHYFDHLRSSVNINYLILSVESCFYGYIFYELSNKLILRKVALLTTLINITLIIFSFAIYKSEPENFIIILIIVGLLLTMTALIYIYTLFVDDNNLSLIKEPGFWIATGVSLFFSGVSIVFSLHNMILKNNLRLFGIMLYNFVPSILSVILYMCISIAIILCKKKTKISSQPY